MCSSYFKTMTYQVDTAFYVELTFLIIPLIVATLIKCMTRNIRG
jgi:hypothetical protein